VIFKDFNVVAAKSLRVISSHLRSRSEASWPGTVRC